MSQHHPSETCNLNLLNDVSFFVVPDGLDIDVDKLILEIIGDSSIKTTDSPGHVGLLQLLPHNEAIETDDRSEGLLTGMTSDDLDTDRHVEELIVEVDYDQLPDLNMHSLNSDVTSSYVDFDAPTYQKTTSVCSPELALSALELSLSTTVLSQFNRCYLNNTSIDDSALFNTWKHYKKLVTENEANSKQNIPSVQPTATSCSTAKFYGKQSFVKTQAMQFTDPLCTFGNTSAPNDDDSDVLPYPRATTTAQGSRKKEVKEHYFVLTAKEVFESKVAAANSKKNKLVELEAKKLARLQAAKVKEDKKKKTKAKKDAQTSSERKNKSITVSLGLGDNFIAKQPSDSLVSNEQAMYSLSQNETAEAVSAIEDILSTELDDGKHKNSPAIMTNAAAIEEKQVKSVNANMKKQKRPIPLKPRKINKQNGDADSNVLPLFKRKELPAVPVNIHTSKGSKPRPSKMENVPERFDSSSNRSGGSLSNENSSRPRRVCFKTKRQDTSEWAL